MSDEPDPPRVVTAPLAAANAPANARPATQMSASAVPSTLDSPQHPSASPPADHAHGAASADEIRANAIAGGETTRDDAARDAALADAGIAPPSVRRIGPATMMSPAVAAPLPGTSSPPLGPEHAVVDVGAPAHAYVPYGSAAPAGGMHHGGQGASHRRGMSTTALVLIVVGVVGAVGVVAVATGAYFFFGRAQGRRGEQSSSSPRSRPDPRDPQRMGGPRARVSVTSSGALDPEAVRSVVNAASPRLDVCFASTEIDPPNHEVATYDLDVATTGEVKRVEPGAELTRAPKLDACVVQTLRSLRMPRTTKACTVKLTFVAPIEP